ncbi:MAG: FmdE family protein [Desulfatiglandaceae bacterium]
MRTKILSEELIRQTIAFHGHWCPGLATGIRAAEWVLIELGKSSDEEIVAIVETDMCAVDAIQFLTGCTFGKGNLIHRDFGKTAFSFYRRRDGKSARLVGRDEVRNEFKPLLDPLYRKMQEHGLTDEEALQLKETKNKVINKIMSCPIEKLFDVKETLLPLPQKARIAKSLLCERCGESVMETRTRRFQGRTLCIPCFEQLESRF